FGESRFEGRVRECERSGGGEQAGESRGRWHDSNHDIDDVSFNMMCDEQKRGGRLEAAYDEVVILILVSATMEGDRIDRRTVIEAPICETINFVIIWLLHIRLYICIILRILDLSIHNLFGGKLEGICRLGVQPHLYGSTSGPPDTTNCFKPIRGMYDSETWMKAPMLLSLCLWPNLVHPLVVQPTIMSMRSTLQMTINYDSDVDEGPNAAVAFMANLSSTSATNNPVNEVHSNDNQIFDNVDYQIQEMHQEEHLDSDAETEIDDNTIPYHQYLLDTEAQNVPTEVSADTSDKVSMIAILTDLQTQLDGHAKVNQEKCLEIETLKNELLQCKQEICRLDTHKVKLDLENKVRQEQALVIQRNKRNAELVQENDLLKVTLSGKEKSIAFLQSEKEKILSEKEKLADSYLDEIVCLKTANKVARDMLQRFNMPTQTIPMLSKKPKKATNDLHKDILGTRNPGLGYMAKRAQPVLYDADTLLHPNHHPVSIWDSEEVLVHQVVSMKKMNEKPGHVRPANGFYDKLNALMFVPQKELSGDQAYWLSANEIASQASKPVKPATPFVHKSRPPSQVLASLRNVNAVFPQFEGIIKERTTQKPDYVSEWCFDYAKQFVEQQLVPFYDHFKKHIQAANDTFFKEIKEFEQIFDELEAEYEQCVLDNKNLTIEKKNLLIKNDCLIAECLEKDICSIVLTSDIVVPPSSNCLCEDLRSACDREHTKVLELEAEVLKQQKMVIESEKHTSSASNAIFEINKLRKQLQGKDDTIRNLDAQISIMTVVECRQVPKGSLVVQIVLWYLDSGCSRHMTGDRARLINFVEKFIGTVRFGNDEYAAIVGYGDYKLGDTIISRRIYV
ncbi:hypothetical protein Tco_0462557, partial [Tanacetum coccineum]